MPRFLLLLAFALSVPLAVWAQTEIGMGDSRDEAIRRHGTPTSTARRGNQEILMYPKGGRIDLTDGKVTGIKEPLPLAGVPTTAEPASPAPATPPATTTPPAATAPSGSSPTGATSAPTPPGVKPLDRGDDLAAVTAAASAPSAKQGASNTTTPGKKSDQPLSPADQLAAQIKQVEDSQMPQEHEPSSTAEFLLMLLVTSVLHFVLTVIALRLAFKYWEMDAFWVGTFAIAGIDTAVFALLEGLGPLTHGITQANSVQGGIGCIVMVFTVRQFCFNKRIQNAVATAFAVRLIVQVLHMFVFVLVLNAMFG